MIIKRTGLRALRKFGLLKYVNLIITKKFDGRKINIPVISGMGYDHFFPTENWMFALLSKLTNQKKGLFIDVGVNLGQTLITLKTIDNEIRYMGFEPNPMCIYYTSELLRHNSFGYVKIVPVGIFSFDGVAKLFFDKSKQVDSCATLLQDFRDTAGQETLLVPVVSNKSLDFLLDEEISTIKIDVEGAELEVLEQLVVYIEKFRPFVICEILPAYSVDNTYRVNRQKKIETLFADLNYKILQIGNEVKYINVIPVVNDVSMANYLFIPKEVTVELSTIQFVD